jgi:hypothetical protein
VGTSPNITLVELQNIATAFDLYNDLMENASTTGSTCLELNNVESATISGGTRLSNCYGGEYITGLSTNIHHYGMQINNQVSNAGQCGGAGGTAGIPILIDNALSIDYQGGLIQKSCNANAVVVNSTACTNNTMFGFHFDNVHIEDVGNTASPGAVYAFYAGGSHLITDVSITHGVHVNDSYGSGTYLFDFYGDGTSLTSSVQLENNANYVSGLWITPRSTGAYVTGIYAGNQLTSTTAGYADFGANLGSLSGAHWWPVGGHHYNMWAGEPAQRGDAGNLTLSDLTSGAAFPLPFHYVQSTGTWYFPFVYAGALSLSADSNIWRCASQYSYTDSDLVCTYNGVNRFRFDNLGNMYFGVGAGNLVIPYNVAGYQGPAAGYVTMCISGTATLVSGTVTVSATAACAVSSSCHYSLTRFATNSSAAIGNLSVGTISAGSSFVINSLSATDTVLTTDVSSVSWQIN